MEEVCSSLICTGSPEATYSARAAAWVCSRADVSVRAGGMLEADRCLIPLASASARAGQRGRSANQIS